MSIGELPHPPLRAPLDPLRTPSRIPSRPPLESPPDGRQIFVFEGSNANEECTASVGVGSEGV
eukprot:607348-Prorocentrum_minimum.AAC.1